MIMDTEKVKNDFRDFLRSFEGSPEQLKNYLMNYGIDEILDDGWNVVSRAKQVVYDFDVFMEEAKSYSNKNPPNVVQFCEKLWGSAVLCVTKFFLANFRILIKSHRAGSEMVEAVCAGLNGTDGQKLWKAWTKAEKCHKNFYKMNFVSLEERNARLELVEDMNRIINQNCKPKPVGDKIWNVGFKLTIRKEEEKKSFKIGAESFPYMWTAS